MDQVALRLYPSACGTEPLHSSEKALGGLDFARNSRRRCYGLAAGGGRQRPWLVAAVSANASYVAFSLKSAGMTVKNPTAYIRFKLKAVGRLRSAGSYLLSIRGLWINSLYGVGGDRAGISAT